MSTIVRLSETSFYGLNAFPIIFWPILNPKNQNTELSQTQFTAGLSLPPKPAVNRRFTIYGFIAQNIIYISIFTNQVQYLWMLIKESYGLGSADINVCLNIL